MAWRTEKHSFTFHRHLNRVTYPQSIIWMCQISHKVFKPILGILMYKQDGEPLSLLESLTFEAKMSSSSPTVSTNYF